MRKVLSASKCSQMSNPTLGTGSGGDRCTEACGAMVDATYRVSSAAKAGADPETLMYNFTRALNAGRTVSVPENFHWFTRWLTNQTHGQMYNHDYIRPSFADCVAVIDSGHIAVAIVDDYVNLRLSNGAKPWPWNDPHGLGHVVLIVGYDSTSAALVVHDPLQALHNMPRDYSWAGFTAARFGTLVEIVAPPLAPGVSTTPTPPPSGGTSTGAQTAVTQFTCLLQILASLVLAVIQLLASYFTNGRLT